MKSSLMTLILLILSLTYSNSQWTQTNGPEGGQISCVNSNGNELFAGTYSGGIYFSENNGEKWQSISAPLTSLKQIRNFVFNGNDIFVATEAGVLFSSEKGKNWELRNNGLTSLNLNDIIKVNEDLFCVGSGGTFKSSDWGISWNPKNIGFEADMVATTCIAIKDNVILRGTKTGSVTGGGTRGGGIYKSTDMGESWLLVGFDKITVYYLKILEDTIFASTSSGLFISTDNGATWLAFGNGIEHIIHSIIEYDGYYYAGSSSGIYISSNQGKDWTKSDFNNTLILSLIEKDGKIFAASEEGIFSTSDNWLTWVKHIDGILSTQIPVIYSFNNKLFVGTTQNGLFISDDDGESYIESVDGLTETSISFLKHYDDMVYAGSYGNPKICKIFNSSDSGKTWKTDITGIPGIGISDFIISGNNYITSTNNGTYYSEDKGKNWINYNFWYPFFSFKKVGNDIYSNSRKGLYISKDDGLNWEFASADLNDTLLYLTILEIQDSTIFSQDYNKGFILSKDLGKTWIRPQNNILTDTSMITCMAIYGSNIIVGTYFGIYLSSDEGENWKQINDGLTNTYIHTLSIKDDFIYAGTAGAGVFKAKLSDFGLINSVENKIEDRNYLYAYPPFPLPAMNEVRSLIYWDMSMEIDIEQIAVYNIYGAKVAGHDKIRLDKLTAYSGNLVWDCSGVESGIYVIHLKHGTENRIIKVIVTK